ncbi:hypothetical protein [Psychromonas ossibalaenae]|uniref:hypothetical protein n=1 Tax=Psychromonas ossibalaenae TaxID=444922 RepID=UPI00037A19E4|nr:hypothetical protein [Psychromonas ossibalaenae]
MKFLIYAIASLMILMASAYFVQNFTLFCVLNLFYGMVLGGVARLKIPQEAVTNIGYFMAVHIPLMFVITLMVGLNLLKF